MSSSHERLHKVLARAGVASRRASEEYVKQGRVRVDGVVAKVGQTVDPNTQEIRFDDQIIKIDAPVAYLVYKPSGVVCTTQDQFHRKSVIDLVPNPRGQRLFPVGRFEEDSEGLVVVTNDGELAHGLVNRSSALRHTYFVKLKGSFEDEALERLRAGVWLSDGKSAPMHARLLKRGKRVTTLMVSPAAQQHRILRRVFAKVGASVEKIVRTRFGPLSTHDLKKGDCRRLTPAELTALRNPSPEDLLPNVRPPSGPRGRPGGAGGRGGQDRSPHAGRPDHEGRERAGSDARRSASAGRDARPAGRDARPAGRDARPAGRDARPAGRDARPAGRDARPAAPGRGTRAPGKKGRPSGSGPSRRVVGP